MFEENVLERFIRGAVSTAPLGSIGRKVTKFIALTPLNSIQ